MSLLGIEVNKTIFMKRIIIATICILLAKVAFTQTSPEKSITEFMSKRFGIFIHFGPVTLRGTEIGWSRYREVPAAEYDTLYREFDPVLFNADTWVRTAKMAGMKYLTITAKHHDGFCLWPTAVSPYNIGNSPFKRDIVKELADACRRQGITFCVYFTVLDWHDPDYPTKDPYDSTKNVKGDMGKFVQTMKSELKEIVTNYHPFMLWFDGNWEGHWTLADGKEIYRYLKELDPGLVINNRIGKGDHSKFDAQSVGDFLTPEQTIGQLNMKDPWESCITLCKQWAWRPNDNMKSLKECIHTLERTAGGNGNLLLNIGPMLDGRMEERQISRLREMGDWLNKYGESIYDTHGGPYPPTTVYATTRKGNKIYVHVLERKDNFLQLAPLPGVIVKKAYFLNGGPVQITQDQKSGYRITLPDTMPDPISSVIVMELDQSAEALPVVH
jgi:alpha-L-fucosidase